MIESKVSKKSQGFSIYSNATSWDSDIGFYHKSYSDDNLEVMIDPSFSEDKPKGDYSDLSISWRNGLNLSIHPINGIEYDYIHVIYEVILEDNIKLYITSELKFFTKSFSPLSIFNLGIGTPILNKDGDFVRVLSSRKITNPYYKEFRTNKELKEWESIGDINGVKIITKVKPFKLVLVNDIVVGL